MYSRKLPSVPAGIVKMFGEAEDTTHEDDPLNHDGRVRSFKHERGNWATYVYIPGMWIDLYSSISRVYKSLLRATSISL